MTGTTIVIKLSIKDMYIYNSCILRQYNTKHQSIKEQIKHKYII
jgi:oligoribonuclease NrnB/cAMP/cGMP phosphodiesterase (DHH superfamily)